MKVLTQYGDVPEAPFIIPDHLEWVYVYVGKTTNQVGYVGRSNSAFGCQGRINAHRREEWHKADKWILHFCPCRNRLESETIEAELINKYNPIGNKDKKGWGSFVGCPDLENMDSIPEDWFGSDYPFKTVLEGLEQRVLNCLIAYKEDNE